MTTLTAATRNALLSELDTLVTHVSLHSAQPDDAGSNELTGGSPAYARQAITFGAPASGQMVSSNQPVFDVPAGATVAFVGLWSAVTGGIFRGSRQLTQEVFGSQGTYTLTSLTENLNNA
jgi:hypothetical protein